jgi:hypothetical protein
MIDRTTEAARPFWRVSSLKSTSPSCEEQSFVPDNTQGLLGFDEDWSAFIRLNQDTVIQDEVAGRIADIYDQTGPYDMLYFDGGEDIHEPFWYNLVNAQYRVYRRLRAEPVVCETALNGHFSGHMMSRSNAYDHFADGKEKLLCRVAPYRAAPARARDFTRIEFGWLSLVPPGNDRGSGGTALCSVVVGGNLVFFVRRSS